MRKRKRQYNRFRGVRLKYIKSNTTPKPEEQYCKRCRKTKPIEQFHKNMVGNHQVQTTCKSCMSNTFKERRKRILAKKEEWGVF